MKELTYSEIKTFIDDLNYPFVYKETSLTYFIALESGGFFCELFKDNTENTADFEGNLKSKGNTQKQLFDQSGKPFARYAIAKQGNALQCLNMQIKTSDKDSLRCMDVDNVTPLSFVSYTLYDVNNVVTTVNANAVMSVATFEPPWNPELVGGMLWQKVTPAESVYAYMVGVPDIPRALGGNHGFCAGGFDLSYLGANQNFGIDGKAPKEMIYSDTYHTNKIQIRFYHSAGFQHDVEVQLRYYKPMVE
jgi:hypothetical protein